MPYRTPDAPPKTRLPILADLTIKTPCKVPWDTMIGDDRSRFCCRCSKNVYNLSAMTEDEAESFLAVHLDDEDACVRLYRRSDGTVLTSDCPVGASRRHRGQVALATGAAAIALTAVASVAGNLRVPRAHSPLRGMHAQFEPPRGPGGPPVRYTLPNPAPAPTPWEPWGRDDSPQSTQGFANGYPASPTYSFRSPSLRQGATNVSEGLPPDVVARIIRQNFGRFRLCYEDALKKSPHLGGRVTTKFSILRDGTTAAVADAGSDLANAEVVSCVQRGFERLTFPLPEHAATVTVTYPIIFNPND